MKAVAQSTVQGNIPQTGKLNFISWKKATFFGISITTFTTHSVQKILKSDKTNVFGEVYRKTSCFVKPLVLSHNSR